MNLKEVNLALAEINNCEFDKDKLRNIKLEIYRKQIKYSKSY